VPRKILIVASEYDPMIASGINRISSFRKILKNAGHDVIVLAADASVYGLASDKNLDAKQSIVRAFGLPRAISRFLKTRYLPIERWLRQPDPYYHWLPFAKRLGLQLLEKEHIDTLFCSYPNYSSLQVGHYLSSERGVALCVDFRDPPTFLNNDAKVDKSATEFSVIQSCLRLASAVTVATERVKKELMDNFEFDAQISVIANGYDQDFVDALPTNDSQSGDQFQVTHIGSFYSRGRDIVRVVRALEDFQKVHRPKRKLVLTLIGDAPDPRDLVHIRALGENIDIVCEPPCSNYEALARAKTADALLLLQGDIFDRQIPAKAYEYLALGRPIWAVVGNAGATRKLLELYSENVVFSDYRDPENINSSLHDLLCLNPVEIDVSHLSRQVESLKLLPVIDSL
jgi:glycosyltransferase involved in cell wall biosynthesis